MKKLFLMIASLFIVTSVAYANPTKSNSIQSDLSFAFGENVKVESIMILDNAQMSEVQGKGWKKKWRKARAKARAWLRKQKLHISYAGHVIVVTAAVRAANLELYLPKFLNTEYKTHYGKGHSNKQFAIDLAISVTGLDIVLK